MTYAALAAPAGTMVTLAIPGPAGGAWTVAADGSGSWRLWRGAPSGPAPAAHVTLPVAIAWRLYTRTLARDAIRSAATIAGDPLLADRLFETVGIVA